MGPSSKLHTVRETIHRTSADGDVVHAREEQAAICLQRAWRKKKMSAYLGPEFLWSDTAAHARMKVGVCFAIECPDLTTVHWRARLAELLLNEAIIILVSDGGGRSC